MVWSIMCWSACRPATCRPAGRTDRRSPDAPSRRVGHLSKHLGQRIGLMRPVVAFLWMMLITCACGCRNRCDSVESELRARESDVRELREDRDRSEFYNQLLQRELAA